jgi:hypothetical protein
MQARTRLRKEHLSNLILIAREREENKQLLLLGIFILSLSEESLPQLDVDLSSVVELKGVVIDGSVVASDLNVSGLGELEAGEGVGQEEEDELRAVPVLSVDVLVVEEVSAEEESEALKVGDLRVGDALDESRVAAVGVHYFLN